MRATPVVATLLWAVAVTGAAAQCRDGIVDLRGDWGSARFTVELADDAASRAQGLMFRETLPRWAGMLFVYDRPQNVSFWMRNTLIELDMLFAGADGRVSRIHHRAQPLDETPVPGGDAVQFVLEINGGMARPLGIAEGTEIRHPAIDPALAAWPCD